MRDFAIFAGGFVAGIVVMAGWILYCIVSTRRTLFKQQYREPYQGTNS